MAHGSLLLSDSFLVNGRKNVQPEIQTTLPLDGCWESIRLRGDAQAAGRARRTRGRTARPQWAESKRSSCPFLVPSSVLSPSTADIPSLAKRGRAREGASKCAPLPDHSSRAATYLTSASNASIIASLCRRYAPPNRFR